MPPAGGQGGRSGRHVADMRRWMVEAWLEDALWLVVLGAPALLIVPAVSAEPDGDPVETAFARGVLAIWGVLVCVAAAWRLRLLPRHLTTQYIEADEHGLLLVQERMWWYPGRELAVPWSDVTSVAREERWINDTLRRLLVVYLTDAGGRLSPVPTFAMYRGRGTGWHGTARLPRLIIYPRRSGDTVREIAQQVREVRPGIVDAAPAQ
ncbi:hypothetical protein F4561_006138 [Lipingzhangella halophila]|uniref:PH domain-containing protein n=1 Tax=Lipingzhangella halophila TaxID=1783352 RepID=A0A7W7RNH3_9ACTN|nr:hypothetical protein [Lipingzhangella halophila]MBB4935244.1 hypothetical protein [Lipingzhangella halophila]